MTQRTRSDSPTKVCSLNDCDRPLRAKGYCASHYNKMVNPPRKATPVECPTCGEVTLKRDASRRFCSLLCRDVWRIDQHDDPMYHTGGRPRGAWICKLPADHPVMWMGATTPVAFIDCAWCGVLFCRRDKRAVYCSKRCGRRASACRRRGREAQDFGFWTWSDFMHIARRFDYRCAYCDIKPTEALQPDHVVPVSKGGANTIANLLPACGPCNSDKRDLLLDDWQVDRVRRGLLPRMTTWAPEDGRYFHLTQYRPKAA